LINPFLLRPLTAAFITSSDSAITFLEEIKETGNMNYLLTL
jgi:hypothetical protein